MPPSRQFNLDNNPILIVESLNVSGTDLLDAIEENTRSGHTAGADNNKNGAFDPSRDRHGLGKVVDKFTDKVLDNPIVRTVAQIAQFTPFAPVASVVNTVITARDVVKAVDEGNIKSLASTVIGAGLSNKLSNSLNLAGDATKISVAQQLQKHALDGVTRATVSTVVAGEDFDDQLKSSLKASAANIISQIGANKIGDLYSEGKLNDVTHKLAHTALGFAAGTAANGDGFSGAVGGLAGSVAGEYFQSENAAVLASAASAALLGGNPLLAANVASTADHFNRQLHQTEIDLIKQKAEAFAAQKGITKAEAIRILLLQALHQVDSLANQEISNNADAMAFLSAISGGNAVFNNGLGQKSNLFLEQDQNIFNNHAINDEFALPNTAHTSLTTSKEPAIRSGSRFPVLNEKQAVDDVLIQDSSRQESYYVPKGIAAEIITKVALDDQIGSKENYKDFEVRMKKMLQVGSAGKGHVLTYEEAKWWWTYAHGKKLTVDGRELSVIDVGLGPFVNPFPHLDNLKVHGSVGQNPNGNGHIYDGDYDFDEKNSGYNPQTIIRNILNDMAIIEHGAGTKFNIQYRYTDDEL